MRLRVALIFAALVACAFVAYFSTSTDRDWSLTTDTMIVFVCDTSGLDGEECSWSGSQHFDIVVKEVRARIRVMVFDNEQILSVLVDAVDASQIEPDSIAIRLTGKDSDGNERDIHLVQRFPTAQIETAADGSVQSWFQQFQIVEDLLVLPDGGLGLNWSMNYRDTNGQVIPLSITVPLRRERITVPSSIVSGDSNQVLLLSKQKNKHRRTRTGIVIGICRHLRQKSVTLVCGSVDFGDWELSGGDAGQGAARKWSSLHCAPRPSARGVRGEFFGRCRDEWFNDRCDGRKGATRSIFSEFQPIFVQSARTIRHGTGRTDSGAFVA